MTKVEQRDDGKYVATCPYDGEEFVAETRMEAINKEGNYRAEKHVNNGNDTGTKSASKSKNIIRKWKTEGKRA